MKTAVSIQNSILEEYINAHTILKEEKDLSPNNERINKTLSSLVKQLTPSMHEAEAEKMLAHPDIQSIRKEMLHLLSLAESRMEEFYAKHYLGKVDALADFSDFIYWRNYVELVKVEVERLRDVLPSFFPSSMVFVGTGPLPLSALLIQEQLQVPALCLDIDPYAYFLGKELVEKADGRYESDYALSDGALFDYSGYDLIWIASLVPNKEAVMKRIYETNPEAIVAIRSVDGIHKLLYEPVDAEQYTLVNCKEIGRTKANPFIINSTIYYSFK